MQMGNLLRGINKCIVVAIMAALGAVMMHAQVAPSAYRGSDTVWVGVDAAYVNASYPYQSGQHLEGLGVFADFNMNVHFTIAASAHFLNFGGFEAETESSYLVGPKFRFRRHGGFQPYAQGLLGVGSIQYPFTIGHAHYFDVAPAAGTTYRLSSRCQLRAEYEYQVWVNSPGYANEPNHQLRPNGFHAGVAFRPFR